MNAKLRPLVVVLLVLAFVNLGLVGVFLWWRGQVRARAIQEQEARFEHKPLTDVPPNTDAPAPSLTPMEEIHAAARSGDVAALRTLLDAHPDLLNANTHNRFGSTALHFAAYFKQPGIVAELLKRGADVNAVNNEGTTPLHDAISAGHQGIARLLLDGGADVSLRNGSGKDALTYAQDKKRTEIAEMIREHPRPAQK